MPGEGSEDPGAGPPQVRDPRCEKGISICLVDRCLQGVGVTFREWVWLAGVVMYCTPSHHTYREVRRKNI